MRLKNFYIPRPCDQCPFRKDTTIRRLGRNRMKGILEDDSFTCHKTYHPDRKQCAGHMLIKKEKNAFVKLAKRLDLPLNLSGEDLVFDSEEDCINHHKNE